MDMLLALFALLVIALPGCAVAQLLVPRETPARGILVAGNGILLGLLLIPLLMRLLSALSVDFSLLGVTGCALACLIAALVMRRGSAATVPGPAPPASGSASLTSGAKLFMVLLGALLAIRLICLGLEIIYRPLYPWDATMHWATKARVWFEHGSIVPFVDNGQWLTALGQGAYTDHHPDYPATIPLLQAWMTTAVGHWDESLMNLPWWLCYLGLGLVFFGQARTAGASPVVAMTFTYMLLSMPLLNTHVALAGYADLFMGACYGAALMALHNWSVTRARGQLILALAFAIGCTLIKNEGFFWLLTLVPGLLVAVLPGRTAALLLLPAVLAAPILIALFPGDIAIAGHTLDRLQLYYRPDALTPIGKSLWLQDNWHLLAYLAVILPPLAFLSAKSGQADYYSVAVALASATALFLVLFLFTRFSYGSIHYTAVGRISLHLAPGFAFLCLLMFHHVYGSIATCTAAPQDSREVAN